MTEEREREMGEDKILMLAFLSYTPSLYLKSEKEFAYHHLLQIMTVGQISFWLSTLKEFACHHHLFSSLWATVLLVETSPSLSFLSQIQRGMLHHSIHQCPIFLSSLINVSLLLSRYMVNYVVQYAWDQMNSLRSILYKQLIFLFPVRFGLLKSINISANPVM